jgi:hypothetical protein
MGLMKRITTELQMGNPAAVLVALVVEPTPVSERVARGLLGLAVEDTVELPLRPDHCTRRRLKPGIDGCGCEFCEAIDGPYMNAEPPEAGLGGGNPPFEVSNEEIARI